MIEPRRRGAVRSETARLAILTATTRLISAAGYEHLSMQGIAAEAGVAKQTIYRWWSSKSALIADCLLEGMLLPERLRPPSTGNVHNDLSAWVESLFGLLRTQHGQGLLRSLIAAAAENVEVGRRLHESLGASSSVVERLSAGVDAGQLRADAPLQELSEAIVGIVILRALSRVSIGQLDAERLVSSILGGAAVPGSA